MDELEDLFNPAISGFLVTPKDSPQLVNKIVGDRSKAENELYQKIISNLTKDLETSGLKPNYSSRILINEIALNLILLYRVKFYLNSRELVQYRYEWKPKEIIENKLKSSKKIEYKDVESKERVHPLYDDFVFKVEKNIDKKLELLGLLPTQQMERQKIQIVERLRKRLLQIETNDVQFDKDLIITKKENI